MTKRVAVAMSGGLDSSVTAYLLQKQGYDVFGITANTTNDENANTIIHNAKSVSDKLGIPFYSLDVSENFSNYVIDYFENSYKKGETPNPCVMCNKNIKWGILFDYAFKELNADYFATGHYARIVNNNGIYQLYPSSDEKKDQLYFLFSLNQDKLSKTLFPLSKYRKDEIRQIAIEQNLPCKSAKESQDICFIQKPNTTKKYLSSILKKQTGNFIEINTGKVLGKHDGFWQYTIGQRKGIGIAASEPLYVVKIDAENNLVYVGNKEFLLTDKLVLNNVLWAEKISKQHFEANVKIRYNMNAVLADVVCEKEFTYVNFKEPVSSVAKGQACVFYDKNDGHLLGGGFI